MQTNQSTTLELTPELEKEITELSTRNLVSFYSDDLKNIGVRRLTESIPPGVLRQMRLHGIISSRRTYRSGKILYLTEKGEKMLREATSICEE